MVQECKPNHLRQGLSYHHYCQRRGSEWPPFGLHFEKICARNASLKPSGVVSFGYHSFWQFQFNFCTKNTNVWFQ